MVDRLSPQDLTYLHIEDASTPLHVGAVSVFQPGRGAAPLDRVTLRRLIAARLGRLPRYRQKIRRVPADLARPVWVDDPDFDIDHHVRAITLPRPGTTEQLWELVARLCARRLDRSRPLWAAYLVDGLADGRVALVTKTHEAMVDGAAVDLAEVVLDTRRTTRDPDPPTWRPAPAPTDLTLVADAFSDLVRSPGEAVAAAQRALLGAPIPARHLLSRVAATATDLFSAAQPAPPSPLSAEPGQRRRFVAVPTALDDHRRVRQAHGGTVHDVVLATIAGALRAWLQSRGEPVPSQAVIRAMLPVGVRADVDDARAVSAGGARVSSVLVDLPVGEPNPVMRLHQVSYAMRAHSSTKRFVDAEALIRLSGFAPATLHALGAKAAVRFSRRRYHLVVTNVPGPQRPRYLCGARLRESYPVPPLGRGQALAIGLTSYHGGVYYGLHADHDAMPDVAVLGEAVEESLAELTQTVR